MRFKDLPIAQKAEIVRRLRRVGKRKPGELPLQRHREIGVGLQVIRRYLDELHIELQVAYPKNARHVRYAGRAAELVALFRCLMDDRVCWEYPEIDDRTRIYYSCLRGPDGQPVVGGNHDVACPFCHSRCTRRDEVSEQGGGQLGPPTATVGATTDKPVQGDWGLTHPEAVL